MSSDKLSEQHWQPGTNESCGVLHHQVPLCPKSFTHNCLAVTGAQMVLYHPFIAVGCRGKKSHEQQNPLFNRELELGIILCTLKNFITI